MKIAIHHRPGSFSDRWIAYCQKQGIDYKVVNAFDSDIIQQVNGCDAFMWHHHHAQFKDVLTAKRILFALEHAGIKVFPDFKTGWHFDDKVAQKYLLEAIDAPLVPSYVFYDKQEALSWAESTDYPKVFKLKGGSGSSNVRLVKNFHESKRLIKKAFGKGFPQTDRFYSFKEHIRRVKEGKSGLIGVLKAIGRLFILPAFAKQQSHERGYVYFQDFIENDGFDIRTTVMNNRAIAFKRLTRRNDFRASGSGDVIFEYENLDKEYISLAFSIAKKLNSRSVAMDFVKSKTGEIKLIEISYGFTADGYEEAFAGYWDSKINWNEEQFNPQEWMLEVLIKPHAIR